MELLIGYFRVSTKKQGESGLGLEAQKKAVADYVKSVNGKLIGSYTEVESGKKNDRKELGKAIVHCERSGGKLVIAKLDRLSRCPYFLAKLEHDKVPFVCCDMPQATPLTIGILAQVAKHERLACIARTTAALGVLTDRGVPLGSARPGHWDGREDRRLLGAKRGAKASQKVRSEAAKEAHEKLCPMLLALRAEGLTLQAIADKLNSEHILTRRHKLWNPVYVHQFLAKCPKCSNS